MKYLKLVPLIIIIVAAVMYDYSTRPLSTALEDIIQRGELVVLTRNAPTTYYIDRDDQPAGYEHDLVRHFAEWLGVSVRFRVLRTVGDIQDSLARGKGHIAAAGLTRVDSRVERFDFGPSYYQVRQKVVCRRGGNRPRNIHDLDSVSLMVTSNSSYEERLKDLRDTSLPGLTWKVMPRYSTEMTLQSVWDGDVDCTVADSNIIAKNQRFFPELVVSFPISEYQDLAWLLPKGSDELSEALDLWFREFEKSGALAWLNTRYYAHVENFDYVDVRRFIHSINDRLPEYRHLFEKVAAEYDFDWTLLAAMSYQESHWDPHAVSFTGVRGMMMLTLRTAEEVGIDNRLDVSQSIEGGARYLADLRQRLPETIAEPDRTWIALAAYNIGMGHIYDARALAEHYGHDKDTWFGLREVLPKLSHPDYYPYVRFGYARGNEPIQYLARIRNYQQILEHYVE